MILIPIKGDFIMADKQEQAVSRITMDELIHQVQAKAIEQGLPDATLRASDAFVRAMCAVIGDTLAEKKAVVLPRLFSLTPQWREERSGHNPQTGEAIKIPAQWKVKLKLSTEMKSRLN